MSSNSGRGVMIYSGFAVSNTISRNVFAGIADGGGPDEVGAANNMLLYNNDGGTTQTSSVFPVHPNTCIGKPCS